MTQEPFAGTLEKQNAEEMKPGKESDPAGTETAETVELTEFEELSCRLFVSWDMVHIDGREIFWDYGILDKENSTWKKAVERYSREMEKVLGYTEEMI